jgi:heat shock protein HslJ
MRKFLPLIVLCLALVAGCDDNDLVAGRELILQSQKGAPPLAGVKLQLRFSDDGLGVYAGCNTIGASYRIRGRTLHVEHLTTTLMLCEPAVDAEDWFQKFLGESPTVEVLPSGEVVLARGAARLVFVDAKSWRPKKPRLDGRAFSLVSQLGAPELENATVQLSFANPPQFQLKGCNYLDGTYAVHDGRLTLTPRATSVMGCEGRGHAWDRWLSTFFTNERPNVDTSGNSLVLQTSAVRLVFAEQTTN